MVDADARLDLYAAEVEDWARRLLVDGRGRISDHLWSRNYASVEDYLESVDGRREAWRRVLNPPELTPVGDPGVGSLPGLPGQWLRLEFTNGLTAQGLLVVPENATRLVVFQHGLGSGPERLFRAGDPDGLYGNVGGMLVEHGYALLAPMNLAGVARRNRAQSVARLAGTTMEGVEFARFQALLGAVGSLAPAVDTSSVALAGMSWGGLAAQFWTPLEPRVAVAASLGWFNDRPNKMLVEDTRYVTFHDSGEHHAYLHGHLLGFGDADLASLICPRPLLIRHGRADAIGWWPQVRDEFARARHHWDALGVGERCQLVLHDEGHVIEPNSLLDFLQTHLPVDRG